MTRKAGIDIRERVLDTAETLFYSNGVRAVGMQQIIDHAGCGKNLETTRAALRDALSDSR